MKTYFTCTVKGIAVVCLLQSCTGLSTATPETHDPSSSKSRRDILGVGFVSIFGLAGVTIAAQPAFAFENKVSAKYDDRPKRRGSKPADLGVLPRKDIVGDEYLGLKHCGAAPNCFCSTDSLEDDPDHSIPAWVWPKGSDQESAFVQLFDVISSYEPGQSNIDGGGFKIVTNDPKKGYMYVQFESLKNGYIDDLELVFIDGAGDHFVQVRSSSRLGYLDYGVNAKRLNYIAAKLREKGWDAKGVDLETHPNYAIQNELV